MSHQTTNNETRCSRSAKAARRYVFGLYLLAAASGVLESVFPENGSLFLAFGFLFATYATAWAYWDAKSRGITILSIVLVLYFMYWPIGAWLYLIYRSGMYGLLAATIHSIGLMATFVIAAGITMYLLHHTGLVDPSFY